MPPLATEMTENGRMRQKPFKSFSSFQNFDNFEIIYSMYTGINFHLVFLDFGSVAEAYSICQA